MFKTEKKCGVYLNETAPAQLPGKERRVKKKKKGVFSHVAPTLVEPTRLWVSPLLWDSPCCLTEGEEKK